MHTVLGKARMLLEAFDAESGELSLTELSRRSGVAKATTYRLANALVEWGLLERSGTRYRLGLRLFELGALVPAQRVLRDAALPYLQELHAATGATVHFAIRDGLDVLYIEKLSGHGAVAIPSRVAGRLPLYATATGKAILAFSGAEVVAQVVENGLSAFTRRTVSAPQLHRQLGTVRQHMLAVEAEEVSLGVVSAAVPVFGPHAVLVGAIGMSTTTPRMNLDRVSGPLKAAGAGITRTLGSLARSA
ncbi:DNA-binding IclR family transcriptional regulator [Nocardia transvalensis]|uniref:DNA-binding IclR family transcriptional regulator n=1 Tax=Nocardia transvalensis TaxID=37333 RepID=A0A7W9UK40_9NOCA|nr:IclR family transcriptional regulator [Nocardia transvalensis]MBB5916128.1 DNA-binding IclR family transcriptional regulator [Nocardia transvalensis]